jgi:chromosome segregation ATPase
MKSNYATLKTKFDEDRQKHGGLISKLAKLKGDLEDSRQNQKAAQRRAKDEETQANWAEQRTKDAKKSRDAIELQTAKFTTESERLEKEIRGRNSELQLVQSQAKAAQELSKKLPGLEAEALKFQAEIKGLKGYMQSLNERTKQLKVAKKEADAAADAAVNAREQRETELGEARGVLSSKQREIAAAHFDLMKLKALLPKNEAPPSSNPASSSIKK